MPIAPQQCGSVLKEIHCRLLPSSVAEYKRSPKAHCSPAIWQCAKGDPLPTTLQQCGSALKEIRYRFATAAIVMVMLLLLLLQWLSLLPVMLLVIIGRDINKQLQHAAPTSTTLIGSRKFSLALAHLLNEI